MKTPILLAVIGAGLIAVALLLFVILSSSDGGEQTDGLPSSATLATLS